MVQLDKDAQEFEKKQKEQQFNINEMGEVGRSTVMPDLNIREHRVPQEMGGFDEMVYWTFKGTLVRTNV